MSSTTTQKTRSRKRKPQSRKRPASSRRKVSRQAPQSTSIVDWLGVGADAASLPGWSDLDKSKGKRKNKRNRVNAMRKQVNSLFGEVSTPQFAILLMIAALSLGFYVSHVFATQETLSVLEQQRRDNLRLELQYNQLKGQLDKKISPNTIYRRAQELGLEEGLAFGPTIQWEHEEN